MSNERRDWLVEEIKELRERIQQLEAEINGEDYLKPKVPFDRKQRLKGADNGN